MSVAVSNLSGSPIRILLVDDNPAALRARQVILEGLGYQITTASTAGEATSLLQQKPFDLFITDHRREGLDGVALIAHVRAGFPNLPTILISGLVEPLGLSEASTGASVVIQKSSTEVNFLARSVQRLVKKKTPRKPPVKQHVKALVHRRSV